jgi:hypothetical protein
MDLPNVTLGIIPMGTELPLMPYDTFQMLDDVATVDTLGGEDKSIGGEDSAMYQRVFADLMAEAATGEHARRLIAAAAADLPR